MPVSRRHKEQLIENYQDSLANAPHVFLMDYKGVRVNQDTELRRRVREAGGSYAVVKNRLVLRVIEGKALEGLKEHFQGPTAVAYCTEDPVRLAKAVTEFAKEVPAFEVKAGLVEGQPVAAGQVQEIAQLPSREELLAKLLYLLQSPISGLVTVLAAVPRQFVVVLDQIRQKKESA